METVSSFPGEIFDCEITQQTRETARLFEQVPILNYATVWTAALWGGAAQEKQLDMQPGCKIIFITL